MPQRWTEALPGSGGYLSQEPADFEVHEILPYEPSGEGEHLFVQIEKRGLTTFEAVDRLTERLGLGRGAAREVGFAGMKDRHAVARQWLSLPWPLARSLPELDPAPGGSALALLAAVRHRHKLRRGHVRGNRFQITLRGVPAGGAERAQLVLEALKRRGVPNRFGPQRFGRGGRNVDDALAFVRDGRRPPEKRRLRDLLVSALQAAIFQRVLDRRLAEGTLDRALSGDVMQKHATGGLFVVEDPAAEQPRVDALEISPTAALPGGRYKRSEGAAGELEDDALRELGIEAGALGRFADGTRRLLRYPLDRSAAVHPLSPESYRLEVELPSGAYATVVLDELVKPEGQVFDRGEQD